MADSRNLEDHSPNDRGNMAQRLDTSVETQPAKPFSWRVILPLFLIVGFSVVVRAGLVSIPLERDEGEYAYIAQRWLAGDVPYRDAFDQKPPGIFLAYAVLFAVGGRSIEAIHWLGHFFLLGAMGFVYLIGRRLFTHLVGCLAAFVMVVLVMDGTVRGSASNTELFAIFPLCAAMYFALRAGEQGGVRDSLLVGLCGGLALCFKQVTLPMVAFCAAWALICQWRARRSAGRTAVPTSLSVSVVPPAGPAARSSLLMLALAQGVGLALVLIPTCLYFLWQGAWRSFIECVVSHNLAYSSRVPLSLYGQILWSVAKVLGMAHWPLLVVVIAGLRWATVRGVQAVRPLLWWWLCSLVSVSVGGHFREHYFILIMPATALLAGYGLGVLGPLLEPKRKQWQSLVSAGVAVVVVIWPIYEHLPYYLPTASTELKCRMLYGFLNPFPESVPIAKLISEHSAASDKIFIFGSEPQILFYANRPSASRYIFLYPLYGGAGDALIRQQAVVQELRNELPKFMVIIHSPNSFSRVQGSPEDLEQELEKIIGENYSRFAAAAFGADGTFRIIPAEPSTEELKPSYELADRERLTMEVWERNDSGGSTQEKKAQETHMVPMRDKLRANLDEVRARIAKAARASGRSVDSVSLVAVTKQIQENVVREFVDLGVLDLGESRPQEIWRRSELVPGPIRWHLIGPLQRNKVRATLPLVHLIHSVDSVPLLNRLEVLAQELDMNPAILLEVNVSGEAAKHGFRPEELPGVLAEAGSFRCVRIRGLMTMAPYDVNPERARPTFAALRELSDRLRTRAPDHCVLAELSMGMSGDFEVAIGEGATIVRIGSALFRGIGDSA